MTGTISATQPNAAGTSAATTTATGNAAASRLQMNEQDFLQMLTTQLKNQDPTQPFDANTMTQQLAQFATVEQQIASNQHMQSLLALQQSSALVGATSLVGRNVEVATDRLVLRDGAAQQLRLPALAEANGATRARIVLTDAAGTTVRDTVVPLGAAATPWTWDGRSGNGRAASAGTYRLAVTGLDPQGSSIGALGSTVVGTVTGTSRADGDPQLSIGGLAAPLAALRAIN
jgi:flagellar basal-body rod modification protein FlgD